jgi:membrane-associated protease RseP (regulator of RpoE activity)
VTPGSSARLAGAYAAWDASSSYGQRLQHIQAVDMIFTDIVGSHDHAAADLRALGLPASWARYAGHYFWERDSVRASPLFPRYAGRLTDTSIAHFLLTRHMIGMILATVLAIPVAVALGGSMAAAAVRRRRGPAGRGERRAQPRLRAFQTSSQGH